MKTGFMATLFLAGLAHANPVINEVMYRPWNQSTFGRYEFVELYNPGTSPVDLGDALLTDSSDLANICQGHLPADFEGVYRIPAQTVIAPHGYLTLWHTAIAGVTDQPGNLVYDHMVFFTNLVLADGGDQVTLMRCAGATPQVIDALDYGALGLAQTSRNVSLERISPTRATQDASNWGHTLVPPGAQNGTDGYTAGGTPGRENSLSDLGAPTVTIAPIADAIVGERIHLSVTAGDEKSGVASLLVYFNGQPVAADAEVRAVPGMNEVFAVATDGFGNSASAAVHFRGSYGFSGFLAPLDVERTYKLGSAIPVKLQLTDVDGYPVGAARARMLDAKRGDVVVNDSDDLDKGHANPDGWFRFDAEAGHHIYNLATDALSVGVWILTVEIDDGTRQQVQVELR